MKLINNLIIVEVPEDIDLDTFSLSTSTDIHFLTKSGEDVDIYTPQLPDIKILNKLSELSEEECGRFVELTNTGLYKNYILDENEVEEIGIQPLSNTAKESLISLLQSNGIDTSKELLIIEVL